MTIQDNIRSRTFAFITITVVVVVATAYLGGFYQPVTFNRMMSVVTKKPVTTYNLNVTNLSTSAGISPENDTESDTQGYLLAVDIGQQITGGFGAFSQLSKIASLLNLSTVEPYISGSFVRGVPKMIESNQPKQQVVTLGTVYDVKSIQNTLQPCGFINQLVSFEAIKMQAHHYVIYVSFAFKNEYISHEKITEIDPHNAIASDMQYFNELKKWVSHISSKQSPLFQLSRMVVVDARPNRPVYLSSITKVLGSIIREEVAKHGTATVVIGRWKGAHNTKGSNFFYYIPDFPNVRCSINDIKHSETVIQAAREFSLTMSQIRPVIGVHIRGERLLRDSRGDFTHCLAKMEVIVQEIINSKNASRDSVHVFHDLGPYGTATCHHNDYCTRGKTALISHIKKLGFPILFFNPTKFNRFPQNYAFIASVEQEYLIHVDVLVTVSRGEFQQSLVDKFSKYSGVNNLHRICSSEREMLAKYQ